MAADQLNSWKELAGYLNCSVRTVQRWEAERGLPVRRLPGQRGAVFALRAEIDQWRLGQPTDINPGVADPPAFNPRRIWLAVAVVSIAVVFIVAGFLYAGRAAAANAVISSFALRNNTLVAIDAKGTTAWTYDFKTSTQLPDTTLHADFGPWARFIDIDGNGVDEVLVFVQQDVERLFAFDAAGALRFSYTPTLSLDYTSRRSSGPWVMLAFEVVPNHGIWVSVTDRVWWPAAVEEISTSGKVTTRFFHPGHIRAMRAISDNGKTRIAMAGVNNEYAAAAVALVDPDVVTLAPQNPSGTFACRQCTGVAPLRYLLLGPSPLIRLANLPYNVATSMLVGRGLLASTYEADQAQILFTLTRNLEVTAADPSDGYWSALARHPEMRRDDSVVVREWRDGGWQASRIKFAPAK